MDNIHQQIKLNQDEIKQGSALYQMLVNAKLQIENKASQE